MKRNKLIINEFNFEGEDRMNNEKNKGINSNNKLKKYIVITLISIFVVAVLGIFIMGSGAYEAGEIAKMSAQSNDQVSVLVDKNIIFTPTNIEPTKGFIFYPGAKVEPMAYAPLCMKIAEQGYEVVIVKMPLNFAVISPDKAEKVIKEYDNIDSWIIGGHSLGGVMASKFASEHDEVEGVALLASYPQGDELKNLDKEVLSIWGDKDGVVNFESLENSKLNLPSDTKFIELKGGNHAQFGDYGNQKGDNEASISAEEQIEKSTEAIIDLLNRVE